MSPIRSVEPDDHCVREVRHRLTAGRRITVPVLERVGLTRLNDDRARRARNVREVDVERNAPRRASGLDLTRSDEAAGCCTAFAESSWKQRFRLAARDTNLC